MHNAKHAGAGRLYPSQLYLNRFTVESFRVHNGSRIAKRMSLALIKTTTYIVEQLWPENCLT